jgi:hypothetical protein
MADTKITQLQPPQLGYPVVPATDVLPIVVIADPGMATSGSTRKVTVNQILGSGGTATLASATITGDLTVDTNTLYVSSSADKVAIGTTSLSNEKLTVAGNISANAWLGRANISAPAGDCSIFRSADNTLGFGIASSTAMTLNSTGLGVGVSPAAKLDVFGNAALTGTSGFKYLYFNLATDTNSVRGAKIGKNYDSPFDLNIHATTSASGLSNEAAIKFYRNLTDVSMTLDSSGNVGIGVTPSAWVTFKAIQHPALSLASYSTTEAYYSQNAYNDGTWRRVAAGYASQYIQVNSEHRFLTAGVSANANDPIAFNPSFTINASGLPIFLATTTTPATLTTNGELTFTATSNTNLRFSYRGSDGTTRVANITLA